MKIILRLFPVVVLICGCASTQVRLPPKAGQTALTSLAPSLRPLQEQFNTDKSRFRVLALFSPT